MTRAKCESPVKQLQQPTLIAVPNSPDALQDGLTVAAASAESGTQVTGWGAKPQPWQSNHPRSPAPKTAVSPFQFNVLAGIASTLVRPKETEQKHSPRVPFCSKSEQTTNTNGPPTFYQNGPTLSIGSLLKPPLGKTSVFGCRLSGRRVDFPFRERPSWRRNRLQSRSIRRWRRKGRS